MQKRKCLTFVIFLFLSCCSHQDEQTSALSISISFPNGIQSGEWIRIDDMMFIHKQDVSINPQIYDSIIAASKVHVCIIPASRLVEHLPTGKITELEIIGTNVLSYMARCISEVNTSDSLYIMNIGARLWLSGELQLQRIDGKK